MIAVQISEDLAGNWIRLRFPNGAFLPWRFALDGEVQELGVEGSLLPTDPNLLVRAAVDGVGIHYTLWDSTAPLIATRHLVPLLETWMPSPSDGFFLYFRSRFGWTGCGAKSGEGRASKRPEAGR